MNPAAAVCVLPKRAMGFEPTTSSLGSWHSTAELRPHFFTQLPHSSRSFLPCKPFPFRDLRDFWCDSLWPELVRRLEPGKRQNRRFVSQFVSQRDTNGKSTVRGTPIRSCF